MGQHAFAIYGRDRKPTPIHERPSHHPVCRLRRGPDLNPIAPRSMLKPASITQEFNFGIEVKLVELGVEPNPKIESRQD